MSKFADYNSYNSSGSTPTAIHPYMMNAAYPESGEDNNDFLTEDSLATEFYLLFGSDVSFIPRELYKEDDVFGEHLSSTFEKGYPLRMFVEEVEAWSGGSDLYSKFGLQVTDEMTGFINKSSFLAQTNNTYPKIDDLIYHHKSKKLFQINGLENECQPSFYRLGNLGSYKFSCKLCSYNHEKINQEIDSGIPVAIQALDALLLDLEGNNVTLPEKEFNQNNKPIITKSVPIIDNTEIDPLG